MSYLEKINIYVPGYIGTMLDNDADLFEILKKDGETINRNRFLNLLIYGYYESYAEECRQTYDSIAAELMNHGISSAKSRELADILLKKVILPEVPSRKGRDPVRLSLKPVRDTEGLIMNIMDSLGGDDFISQYFCRMLMSYCKKPFSEREKIIFRDNYETLKEACEQEKTITFSTIWNTKTPHTVVPYRLAAGREEMYNYLLCAETDKTTGRQEARSYRLNRITGLSYSRSREHIPEEVRNYLDSMIRQGPQYMINDTEEVCVRLTDAGKRNFRRIYYGRPAADRIEDRPDGHYYYFKGSKDQIYLYFKRFEADDAEILTPAFLRQKMINFHLRALENYTSEEKLPEIRKHSSSG